jgi:cytidyltransferase-like protein
VADNHKDELRRGGSNPPFPKERMVTVAVSGYFDPLNGEGHISYIQEARKLGDRLVVILNNDKQLLLKKGRSFYPGLEDRLAIIRALKAVDDVVVSVDEDLAVPKTLKLVHPDIFAKGGDRTPDNMPQSELDVCTEMGCLVYYNVGNPKVTSSQELLRSYERRQ